MNDQMQQNKNNDNNNEYNNNLFDIQMKNIESKEQINKQTVSIIKCLHQLLRVSQYLSSNFSNNIMQLHSLGKIDIKILLYLSVYAKFDSNIYYPILNTLWNIYHNQYVHGNNNSNMDINNNIDINSNSNNNRNIKRNKVIQYYFIKLIIKSCKYNYLCIDLYYSIFYNHFPRLINSIIKIQNVYYSFLNNCNNTLDTSANPNQIQQHHHSNNNDNGDDNNNNNGNNRNNNGYDNLNIQQLLDRCYQQTSIKPQISQQLSQIILNSINKNIQNKQINSYTLLLCYYLSAQNRVQYQIDQQITQLFINKIQSSSIKNNNININKSQILKYLKISLTVCNYKLSYKLLQHISNNYIKISQRFMSVIMLFTLYSQFHLQQQQQQLQQILKTFIEVANKLAEAGQHFGLIKIIKNGKNCIFLPICRVKFNQTIMQMQQDHHNKTREVKALIKQNVSNNQNTYKTIQPIEQQLQIYTQTNLILYSQEYLMTIKNTVRYTLENKQYLIFLDICDHQCIYIT